MRVSSVEIQVHIEFSVDVEYMVYIFIGIATISEKWNSFRVLFEIEGRSYDRLLTPPDAGLSGALVSSRQPRLK